MNELRKCWVMKAKCKLLSQPSLWRVGSALDLSAIEYLVPTISICRGFSHSSAVKNLPANAGDTGDRGSIPGSEDPLGEVLATHSSILAWRIP